MLMARLRGENGCPWDRQQTHQSLRSFLLEEAHELLDALAAGEAAKIREELGDLLHQIVFHCQIGAENNTFSAEEVIDALAEKMVRRHPHVFSSGLLTDSESVAKQWAQIKARENPGGSSTSILGNLPRSMPALARAQTLTERASRVGFDWPNIGPVWRKIDEEMAELKSACAAGDQRRIADELGDVFFSLVNLARFLGVNAEDVVSQAADKFLRRFRYLEKKLAEDGKTPQSTSLEEMDRLWDQAKEVERRGSKPT